MDPSVFCIISRKKCVDYFSPYIYIYIHEAITFSCWNTFIFAVGINSIMNRKHLVLRPLMEVNRWRSGFRAHVYTLTPPQNIPPGVPPPGGPAEGAYHASDISSQGPLYINPGGFCGDDATSNMYVKGGIIVINGMYVKYLVVCMYVCGVWMAHKILLSTIHTSGGGGSGGGSSSNQPYIIYLVYIHTAKKTSRNTRFLHHLFCFYILPGIWYVYTNDGCLQYLGFFRESNQCWLHNLLRVSTMQ